MARPCRVDCRLRVGISRNASTNRRYFDNAGGGPPLTRGHAAAAVDVDVLAWAARIASAGVRWGIEAILAAIRRGQARLSTPLAVATFPRSIQRLVAGGPEATPDAARLLRIGQERGASPDHWRAGRSH